MMHRRDISVDEECPERSPEHREAFGDARPLAEVEAARRRWAEDFDRRFQREVDAPARVAFADPALQEFAKDAGLKLSAPSPHHLQVRQDGAVFAEWWPSKGTTRMDGKPGPRCRTVAEFIDWLQSA